MAKNKHSIGQDLNEQKNVGDNRDMTVGETLKRERTKRGVTLDDIARDTKIAKMFLIALENDDLKGLPGGIYTRNFLRSYAGFLGLDCDIITSEFNAQFNIKPQSIIVLERTKGDDRDYRKEKRRGLLVLIVVVVILALLAYGILTFSPVFDPPVASNIASEPVAEYRTLSPAESSDMSAQSNAATPPLEDEYAPPVSEVADMDLQGEESSELLADAPTEPTTSVARIPSSLPLTGLRDIPIVNASSAVIDEVFAIEALDDVWVEVQIDGQELTKRMLRGGEIRVYKYGATNVLRLGDIASVALQDQSRHLGRLTESHSFVGMVVFEPGTLGRSLIETLARRGPQDGNNQ